MKNLFFLILFGLVSWSALGQGSPEVIDGAYKRSMNLSVSKDPIKLPEIQEQDVMFSWTILRVIDLNQKLNMPFTHPKSMLINVLMDALKKGNLNGYIYRSDELNDANKMQASEILNALEKYDTITVSNPITFALERRVEKVEFNPNDVVKFRLKEEWVFDRKTAGMVVRIVAIAPVQNLKSDGIVVGEIPMFWLYFPAIRPILAKAEVFNMKNESAKISYDDVFLRRFFSSYIYKEPNVKDVRIEDYASNPEDFLMESERIKQKMFNFEQSLWDY
ncbi:MAG: gliding motility protein GldN [Sphingomonadales bacterium]|nr:gliding motility protein GldN [Sphingomonadales bacterium]MBM3931642.1 gliding motility protein GldN [Sphingomonadales bacterium]